MSEIYRKAVIAKEAKDWGQLYHCLQDLAKTPLEKEQQQGLVVIIEESLKEEDFRGRWDLIKILPQFGAILAEPLILLLEDEQQEVELRWFVIQVLGQLKTVNIVLALSRLLQTTQEESLLLMASQTLAQIGSNSIAELAQLLAVENLHNLVIQTLSRIIHPDVIPYLQEAYKDSDATIRYKVIEALSSFPDPNLISTLIQALEDPTAAVRKQGLIGLKYWCKEQKRPDLFAVIQPLLYDFDIEVCGQAVLNLVELGGEAVTRELGKLLESPLTPLELKQDTIRGLSWLESPLALEFLENTLKSETRELLVKEIIIFLGRVKEHPLKKQSVRILENFYRSGLPEDIKLAITVSLGELGQPECFKILETLKEDTQLRIRLHAIAALKKLSY